MYRVEMMSGNQDKADEWLSQAIIEGDSFAVLIKAGFRRDDSQAFEKLAIESAQLGNRSAMEELVRLYDEQGDYVRFSQWSLALSLAGDRNALRNLVKKAEAEPKLIEQLSDEEWCSVAITAHRIRQIPAGAEAIRSMCAQIKNPASATSAAILHSETNKRNSEVDFYVPIGCSELPGANGRE